MTRLLVATLNDGKLHELQQMLSHLPLVLLNLSSFPVEEIEETGVSFIENATLKARGYALQTRLPTLADDSGLEIDALGGRPGIFSARYLGESVSFETRIDSLLKLLTSVPPAERTAHFTCVIAIADREGCILNTSTGVCNGRIAPRPRGSGGFGYDPVFIPDGYDLTFGELPPEIKNQISHRAKALKGTREYLRSLTGTLHAD